MVGKIYPKKVFYAEEEKKEIFPTSMLLEKHWKSIRQEAINIVSYKSQNVGKNFITASEDFWEGWRTIPLRMFHKDHSKTLNKCPVLKEILVNNDEVVTAFFSVMEAGKTLSSHYGPFKGILRYHLGLVIPPKETGNCFISVDGNVYDWKEGEGILFDETYKHFVRNETNQDRIILFIDVKRPFRSVAGKLIRNSIIWTMGNSPYNQI